MYGCSLFDVSRKGYIPFYLYIFDARYICSKWKRFFVMRPKMTKKEQKKALTVRGRVVNVGTQPVTVTLYLNKTIWWVQNNCSEFSILIGATWVGTLVRYVQCKICTHITLYCISTVEQIHIIEKELQRAMQKPNSWTCNFVEVSGHNL